MKFISGFVTGMVLAIAGEMVCMMLFPKTKEEICETLGKIPKDMEKDLKDM